MESVKQPAIIFDFDDTLVSSHQLFVQAEQQFCQRMRELGLYDDDLLTYVQEQDIANVEALGYLAYDCFARALSQTYAAYCEKSGFSPLPKEQLRFEEMGHQPYLQRPAEMPGARELLERLQADYGGYRRLLYTQGEKWLQQWRVNECGLAPYFHAVEIVRVKDTAALKKFLQEQQVEPKLSWYIGNSLRADINPAIAVGLGAVHLDINAWSYEHEEATGAYHTISELKQFIGLLREA